MFSYGSRRGRRCVAAAGLAVGLTLGSGAGAQAAEDGAKALLKAMSDYLAAQSTISFDYDAVHEVVTDEGQRLGLASSGTVTLARPGAIRATRSGGFADLEMLFDGKTFTVLGRNANLYAQVGIPGTVDDLIDALRDTYGRPLPAADLLMADANAALMSEVTDVKDLGSGVIGGQECDWLAFRTPDVDWQIWIAQGARPYPCRYAITSTGVAHEPQYVIQVRDWRDGAEVAAADFAFAPPAGATKITLEDLHAQVSEFPEHFSMGDAK